MRPLEIALAALLVLTVLAWLRCVVMRVPARLFLPLPAAAISVGLAHLLFEGGRWQFYPAYLLALVLFGAALRPQDFVESGPGLRRLRMGAGIAALALVAVCVALAWVLPVPQLPLPRGPHPVGTATFYIEDLGRPDPYTTPPGGKRRIMLQVWYPAASVEGAERAPWSDGIGHFGAALARRIGLPSFVLGHLALIGSNSFIDAPLLAGDAGLPVVVYSHGWTGFRTIALDELEHLASHGYFVAAADHTYGALGTVFPNDEVVLNNPSAMPPGSPPEARQAGIELLVETYAGDVRFVIDTLERMQDGAMPSAFSGRLDLGRLGVFGHSTGAGAIYEVCALDARVKCGFGLDPWLEPVSADVRAMPLRVPFYALRSAQWVGSGSKNIPVIKALLGQSEAPVYDYYLLDSKHADFTLLQLLSPAIGMINMTGPIDGRRAMAVTNDYLLGFFDQYLRGQESPLLGKDSAAHPEIRRAGAEE